MLKYVYMCAFLCYREESMTSIMEEGRKKIEYKNVKRWRYLVREDEKRRCRNKESTSLYGWHT